MLCTEEVKYLFVLRSRQLSTADSKILRSCRISLTPLLHGVECGHAACCSTPCGIKIWPANAATHNIRHGDDALCVVCSWLFAQKILSKKVFSVRAIAESSEKFDK